MNIHQLSLNHDPLQDRILLRINTTSKEEIRVWLTRRLTLGLQPHLERIGVDVLSKESAVQSPLHNEQARQMMAEFKQQENLSKADFSTPYAAPEKFLLGPEPLLVTDIQLSPQNDSTVVLAFQEKLGAPPHRGFQARVKADLIVGLQHLLRDAVAQAGWLKTDGLIQAEQTVPEAAAPPKGYLN
jgi:hypothetical protein